jgi:hypothetical protein
MSICKLVIREKRHDQEALMFPVQLVELNVMSALIYFASHTSLILLKHANQNKYSRIRL